MKTIIAECSLCASTHVRFMAVLKLADDELAAGRDVPWADSQRPRFDAHNAKEHEGNAELLLGKGPYG